MPDVPTQGGLSYVPLASGYRDSGGAPVPQAFLFGVSDGTKVIPVGPGVPVPVSIVAGGGGGGTVQDTAAEAALGAPADAAWGGTGSSSIVAALKAIWAKLSGTLTTSVSNWPATQTVVSTTTGNLATNQISVAATATLIVAARTGRVSVTVQQFGTTPVFLGGSGVTVGTGVRLPGTADVTYTFDGGAAIYGIVATGNQSVAYVESY